MLSALSQASEIPSLLSISFLCLNMARQEDVSEALKTADQMEWVRRMNNIHSRAEEIVLTELVFVP